VPFALADVDEGIVATATHAYVASAMTATAGVDPEEPIAEAAEWIRRGLALNRGAVFGALLALDDARAVERLAALRLLLSASEVEVACRLLGRSPGPLALSFLRDWAELVADGPLQRERLALHAVIGERCRAQAA
jgi:hypothetical protein